MVDVLVVNDCATDRQFIGELLKQCQEWTIHESGSEEALAWLENSPPDLLVANLDPFPANGAPQLAPHLLIDDILSARPGLPLVLVTPHGTTPEALCALEHGAASYVSQQTLREDLLEVVHQVLAASQEDRIRRRLRSCVQQQQFEFCIPNDDDLLAALVALLQEAAALQGTFSEAERMRIGVALQEALTNASLHGNLELSSSLREVDHNAFYNLARQRRQQSPYAARRVRVSANFSPEEVVYQIRDEGPGFDCSHIPDPTDPLYLERPCGRGLLLMRTFMDEVRYNSVGNAVTLIKRRSLPASADVKNT